MNTFIHLNCIQSQENRLIHRKYLYATTLLIYYRKFSSTKQNNYWGGHSSAVQYATLFIFHLCVDNIKVSLKHSYARKRFYFLFNCDATAMEIEGCS